MQCPNCNHCGMQCTSCKTVISSATRSTSALRCFTEYELMKELERRQRPSLIAADIKTDVVTDSFKGDKL